MAKSTTSTNTAASETGVPKFASLAEENAYYNQPVKIKLFKDNSKYRNDVFVAVNGVGMIVPRGVEVEIPRKYAEALKNSEYQDNFAVEYQNGISADSGSSELSE